MLAAGLGPASSSQRLPVQGMHWLYWFARWAELLGDLGVPN